MEENKKALLKKLLGLAKNGVGGEKINAQAMLNKLMKKYDLTDSDLAHIEDSISFRTFSYKTKIEFRILIQVIFKVIDCLEMIPCKKSIGCRCTVEQAIEIEFLFNFHKKLFTKELELFFNAYCQKHRLFGKKDDNIPDSHLSDEEMRRLLDMESALSNETPQKQIAEKSTKWDV